MLRLLLLLAVLFGPLSVFATTVIPEGTTQLEYVTGGVVFKDGPGAGTFFGRTFTNPSSRGGALVVTETVGATVGGNALRVVAQRALPAAAAITAAKQSFLVGCEAGTALSAYLGLGDPGHGSRVGCNVTEWLFDQGQDPIQTTGSAWGNNSVGFIYPDWKTACDASILAAFKSNAQLNMYTLQTPYSYTMGSSTHYYCSAQVVSGTTPKGAINTDVNLKSGVTMSKCPASIDALDPAYNIPEGSSPGPDGKCPTGRYNHIDPADAASRIDQFGNYAKAADAAQAVLANGGVLSGASDFSLSGPASITGTPSTTTTTNPDGSTTTVTKTPTTNYTYNGNTVNYNTSTVTVTNNCTSAGSCTQTTTGETKPPEQPDQCKENPNSLGCISLGTPPTDSPTWSSKNINFDVKPLALPAACPAPTDFSLAGWSWRLDYTPLCSGAVLLALGIKLIAAFGAMIWVYMSLR